MLYLIVCIVNTHTHTRNLYFISVDQDNCAMRQPVDIYVHSGYLSADVFFEPYWTPRNRVVGRTDPLPSGTAALP